VCLPSLAPVTGDWVALNFTVSTAHTLIRDDVGQLHVHLRERFLRVLHAAGLGFEQRAALTPQRAQHAAARSS
jgi:hypothetical protein